MHKMQSGGWPYSEVGRDSSKTPSLRVTVLHAAVFRSLHSNRNRRACMHALIVMPRPLSVSQETIIIVLQRSIRSVCCLETRESVSREFFLYNNIGKSIRAWSCVRYNVSPLFGASDKRELTVVAFTHPGQYWLPLEL